MHRQRLADRRDGGRRRRHERVVRVCGRSISEVARTCVYDRANLGRSDPAAGPRGLSDLVGDLEALLQAAKIPGPYVLVGTSGGGYITAGYAYEHPDEVAGMVFVETPPRSAIRLG